MYKHIVFDFDGTIVDSIHVIITIYNELALKYNFKQVSQEDYKLLNNLSTRERFKALHVPFYRLILLRKLNKEFKDKYNDYIDALVFLKGMKEVLEILLKKGLKISIITSNSSSNVMAFLKHQGMHSLHEVRSSNGLFGKHQTLKKYMKENQLDRREVIYIGDEHRDVIACKKCKIDVIGVTWGLDTKNLLSSAGPTYLIEQPHEIINVVTEI